MEIEERYCQFCGHFIAETTDEWWAIFKSYPCMYCPADGETYAPE